MRAKLLESETEESFSISESWLLLMDVKKTYIIVKKLRYCRLLVSTLAYFGLLST
jgi:hypothetical protein